MSTAEAIRKTSGQWAAENPILDDGTHGIEIDSNFLKIGDSVHPWNDLPYINALVTGGEESLIQQRTASAWNALNPILTRQTLGYETDSSWAKIGDGVSRWKDLQYLMTRGASPVDLDRYGPLYAAAYRNAVATSGVTKRKGVLVASARVSSDSRPRRIRSAVASARFGAVLSGSRDRRFTTALGSARFSSVATLLKPLRKSASIGAARFSGRVTGSRGVIVTNRPYKPAAIPGGAKDATPTNLATVYSNASAGDQIVLADGTYPGNWTFSRKFGTNPVIIRSANPHKAIFPGRILMGGGTGHWLYEVKTTAQGANRETAIVTCGNQTIITRCWFQSRNAVLVDANAGFKDHVWVGWNRFNGAGTTAGGEASLYLQKDAGSHGMQFSDIYIYRNYFNDPGPGPGSGKTSYHINIGDSHVFDGLYPGMRNDGDIALFSNFYIEENYGSPNTNCPRLCYLKNGVTMVTRNRWARNGGFGVFSQRHGYGTKYYGNRVAGGSCEMGGGGKSTQYTEMRANVGGSWNLGWGYSKASDDGNDHQAADFYLIFGNNCSLEIGENVGHILTYDGGRINDVRVYKHTGSIKIDAATCDEDSFTIDVNNNPENLQYPPATPITDANGTVSASFDGDDCGLETGNQD